MTFLRLKIQQSIFMTSYYFHRNSEYTNLQYKADEYTAEVFSFDTELKLSEGLNEWHAFNVANSPTKLQQSTVDTRVTITAHTS